MTFAGCTVGEAVRFVVTGDEAMSTCLLTAPDAAGFAGSAPAAAGEAIATLVSPNDTGTYTVEAHGVTSGLAGTAQIIVVPPLPGTL
jgi:hypothetical protein